jgi:hypothetical protein
METEAATPLCVTADELHCLSEAMLHAGRGTGRIDAQPSPPPLCDGRKEEKKHRTCGGGGLFPSYACTRT